MLHPQLTGYIRPAVGIGRRHGPQGSQPDFAFKGCSKRNIGEAAVRRVGLDA